jgi:4-amino-4-deoxy-L-arabinose transferase-like glycosyltransferase
VRRGHCIRATDASGYLRARAGPGDLMREPCINSGERYKGMQRSRVENHTFVCRLSHALLGARGLLLGAVLVGSALRLVGLGDVPPALNQDEAVSGYDAWCLWATGRDHHGHPFSFAGLESFGDWVSPLLTLLTVPAVGVLGLRVEAVRAVSSTLGVLAIPFIYGLAVSLFGKRSIAVLAAWLVAISPWHVHLSRWAIPPSIVPTMLAATLWLTVRAAERSSGRALVGAALLAGLTMASYPPMKLFVPLMGLGAVILYGLSGVRFKRESLLYAVVVLGVVAGPIVHLGLLDPGGRARLELVSAFRAPGAGMASLVRNYFSFLSPAYLFQRGDGDPMHTPPGYGVLMWAEAPLLVAGILALVATSFHRARSRDRRSSILLLALLVLYPLPGSLTQPSPHVLRGSHLIPLAAIIAGVGMNALVEAGRYLWHRSQRTVALGPPLLASLALGLLPAVAQAAPRLRDYFQAYPREVETDFQYGLKPAYEYMLAHQEEYDEIWASARQINQPYIFALFYGKWPPSKVHVTLVVRREPPAPNAVLSIGKFRFEDLPMDSLRDLHEVFTVRNSQGQPAYSLRRAGLGNRSVLLLTRPP